MRVVKSAEDRKNEILDIAEQLFSTKGFDNTSTNDIIAAIGIARGTLYHHFKSKEDILDAMIERMTINMLAEASAIAKDKNIPILDRLTLTIRSLNVDSSLGQEVMVQVHKPQNALLHQKLQEKMINEVVPLIATIVEEGCAAGILSTRYPKEAAEMVIVYSNIAFDELMDLKPEEQMQKIQAFIYHTEKIMGAKEGMLQKSIMDIFI